MIFPMYKSDNKLNKKIGKVSDYTLKQIELLRNDITLEKAEIKFKIGSPIFYRSDKRYYLKLTNLEFVNYYSENSFQKLLLDIPDNVIPLLHLKQEKICLTKCKILRVGKKQTCLQGKARAFRYEY